MEIPFCFGCNEQSFFDRFEATKNQRESYKPIFLAITNSSFGELSPSFGLFLKNGRFYTVYGTECSVWDFNGQFKPELTTTKILLEHIKEGIGIKDGNDIFNTDLKKCVLMLEKEHNEKAVNKELSLYAEFLLAEPILGIAPINPNKMDLFKENRLDIEDGISFYFFNATSDSGNKVNLFIDDNGYIQIEKNENEPINEFSPFITKFISDIKGSLDLGINIFKEEPIKPKPKKTF